MGTQKLTAASLFLSLALAGCAGRDGPGPEFAPPAGCAVTEAADESPDTVRIVLPGPVDPGNAPVPGSESERILFGHLYETLFTIDCEGDVHPGLAAEWYPGDGGRRWTFVLRRGAKFWDGKPVKAGDIAGCWQDASIEPLIWEAGVDSVAAAGEEAVHVYFSAPHPELPRELAAPPFAIARMMPRWPLGTTAAGINIEPMWSSLMYRRPLTVTPVRGAEGPVLVFIEPGLSGPSDPRDILEDTADLMLTGEPEVIEYASQRPHLRVLPLPWSRTYVLLSISRVRELRLGGSPPGLDREFSHKLARDAVPGTARAHEGPGWWEAGTGCITERDAPRRHPMPRDDERKIVFDAADPVARGLAERILALAGSSPVSSSAAAKLAAAVPGISSDPRPLSIEGMTAAEIETGLRDGRHYAYIIWLPVHAPDPCSGLRELAGRAPWLTGPGAWSAGALLPLVDTRMHAIVGRLAAGMTVDWYGNVRITGARRSEALPPGR